MLEAQRANLTDERLPPIRAQLLIYPSVQWVNLSTASFLANRCARAASAPAPEYRTLPLVYSTVLYSRAHNKTKKTLLFTMCRHDPFLTKAAAVRFIAHYLVGQPRALEPSFNRALHSGAHLTRATRERFAHLFEFDKAMQVASNHLNTSSVYIL